MLLLCLLGCCRFGADLAKQLTSSLLNVLVSCGTVKICFADRTPEKVCCAQCSFLGDCYIIYISIYIHTHVHTALADASINRYLILLQRNLVMIQGFSFGMVKV